MDKAWQRRRLYKVRPRGLKEGGREGQMKTGREVQERGGLGLKS
jgi:hypothetical protein